MEIRESSTPVREFRTTAVSSVATIQAISIPRDADGFAVYAPTNAYNLQLAPRISFCGKTADGGVTLTDYTKYATGEESGSVDLDSLDTAANGDYWYLASHYKFGGATINVDDSHPNATASTMTGYYYNGTAWGDITITDGTALTGACIGQDGNVTWTVPSDWATVTIKGIPNLYVVRFQVDTQLDSDTLISGIALLSGLAGAVLVAATTYVFGLDREVTGALNIDENGATTQTIRVNWLNQGKPRGI
jgi:hypothetical protein